MADDVRGGCPLSKPLYLWVGGAAASDGARHLANQTEPCCTSFNLLFIFQIQKRSKRFYT